MLRSSSESEDEEEDDEEDDDEEEEEEEDGMAVRDQHGSAPSSTLERVKRQRDSSPPARRYQCTHSAVAGACALGAGSAFRPYYTAYTVLAS
eukprot:COSAG02_NODE_14003_length_1322_cov_1.565004_1_plen_92_part_00